jgi:membrane associated rhomboid family serine protease
MRCDGAEHNWFQAVGEKHSDSAFLWDLAGVQTDIAIRSGTPIFSGTTCAGSSLSSDARMTSPDATMIPARSRRQAMDWSLVLLSQGIECLVERAEHGWGLFVEESDSGRAVAVIHQYEIENRGWPWSQRLTWPKAGFDLSAALWCLALAAIHGLSAMTAGFQSAGRMDSAAVQNGAWWRVFTAMSLHADLAHLMANLTIGFAVLGLAMSRYGPGCALLAAYLAGAGGNVAGLLLRSDPYFGIGASGMVMGGLGLLTIQSLALWRARPAAIAWKYIGGGILGGLMLFALLGLDPSSDVIAHAGGFACGLVLGALLAIIPQRYLFRTDVNTFSVATLLCLAFETWVLAWRHALPPP